MNSTIDYNTFLSIYKWYGKGVTKLEMLHRLSVYISFQIWMDEDLETLSDHCNGVTCNKEFYASKLILQGMTKKSTLGICQCL